MVSDCFWRCLLVLVQILLRMLFGHEDSTGFRVGGLEFGALNLKLLWGQGRSGQWTEPLDL